MVESWEPMIIEDTYARIQGPSVQVGMHEGSLTFAMQFYFATHSPKKYAEQIDLIHSADYGYIWHLLMISDLKSLHYRLKNADGWYSGYPL